MAFVRYGEIYRIWFDNDSSGKCYIGQTVQGTRTRVRQHIIDATRKDGGCPLLDDATRKYGIRHMKFEIIEDGIMTHSELDEAEKYWIKRYDSRTPNGYNVKNGGQGKSVRDDFEHDNIAAGFIRGMLKKAFRGLLYDIAGKIGIPSSLMSVVLHNHRKTNFT